MREWQRARRRLRPGMVRDAIVAYLQGVDEASVAEIQAAVAAALDKEVSPSSVRSSLRLHEPALVTRTRRGYYRLNRR